MSVEWGYEIHSVTIGPRCWKKIQEGKEWGTGGETYYYEGERFSCYWDFNCRGEPGSLIVSYGNDGGEGYCGKWANVDITEQLVNIESVSRDEGAIADAVETAGPRPPVRGRAKAAS